MEPWGFEPQIPPCHGGVIPFHYGPGIGFAGATVASGEKSNLIRGRWLSSVSGSGAIRCERIICWQRRTARDGPARPSSAALAGTASPPRVISNSRLRHDAGQLFKNRTIGVGPIVDAVAITTPQQDSGSHEFCDAPLECPRRAIPGMERARRIPRSRTALSCVRARLRTLDPHLRYQRDCEGRTD